MTTWSTTGARIGHRLGSVAIAAGVAGAIVLVANINRPAIHLASADSVDVVPGVSIAPAPGWTVADRGPDWVALSNVNGSGQLQVEVRPASGNDLVAMLQADVNQLTGTPAAGLTNVKNLSAPKTGTLQGRQFGQEAFIDYTADVSGVPVLGTFSELLNPATHRTAFIDYRQNDSASTQVTDDGGAMVNSLP
jgi:hypothetical protein